MEPLSLRMNSGGRRSKRKSLAVLLLGIVAIVSLAVSCSDGRRERIAANDGVAAANMRSLNTVEITYSTMYPTSGFAADLATLGPGPTGTCPPEGGTPQYACLLDNELGNARCTQGVPCTKGGFSYTVTGIGGKTPSDYVIFAAPLGPLTGDRDYCSMSDAAVRYQSDPSPPGTLINTVATCQTLNPL